MSLCEHDLVILRAVRQLHETFPAEWAFTADQIAEAGPVERCDVISRTVQLLCDAYLMGEPTDETRPRYRLSARGAARLTANEAAAPAAVPLAARRRATPPRLQGSRGSGVVRALQWRRSLGGRAELGEHDGCLGSSAP